MAIITGTDKLYFMFFYTCIWCRKLYEIDEKSSMLLSIQILKLLISNYENYYMIDSGHNGICKI